MMAELEETFKEFTKLNIGIWIISSEIANISCEMPCPSLPKTNMKSCGNLYEDTFLDMGVISAEIIGIDRSFFSMSRSLQRFFDVEQAANATVPMDTRTDLLRYGELVVESVMMDSKPSPTAFLMIPPTLSELTIPFSAMIGPFIEEKGVETGSSTIDIMGL